jgi:hypothetical protein
MPKILFLVRSISQFKTQRRDIDFIIENLIKNGFEVHIYDPKQKLLMDINNKLIIDYSIFPKILNKTKLYYLLNFLVLIKFSIKNKGKYDIVQINYVREEYLILPNLINKLGKKLVITLFGTDINKRSFIKNNFTKLYKLANEIICTNISFGEKANQYVKGNIILNKINVFSFPQDHFSYYRNFQYDDKIKAKIKMKIPIDKICVIIGANSTSNEQHEKIINQLKSINKYSQYYFVFPLSNRLGKKNDREKMLEEYIKEKLLNFNYKIIFDFISYEDMAQLRLASDIYLNLRLKDQFAATMLESNLSYTNIITGSWLPYEDYSRKVKLNFIDTIENLNDQIEKITTINQNEIKINLKNNREAVILNYDNNIIEKWMNFYSNILKF